MPARFANGKASPRPNFECYFDSQGLKAMDSKDWGASGWNNVGRSVAEMVGLNGAKPTPQARP
jgi:hypothetical protein